MRVKARVRTLAARVLSESMDVKTMVHLARGLLGSYDLNDRTGFPQSIPIPSRTAAQQIVEDTVEAGLFLDFVALLLEIERLGMAGRKYRFPRLGAIMSEIMETGYRYDVEIRSFVEDTSIRTTRNWGVLREGETYVMAFVGIDVVGNSRLVKQYGNTVMRGVYADVRRMAATAAEKRNGRLWGWEGDGGVLAFTFEEHNQRATLAGIELLNEVFLYNLTGCTVDGGVHVRLTVHNGPCEYHDNGSELKVDTLKRLWDVDDRFGRPDTLILTDAVFPSLDRQVTSVLVPVPISRDQNCYAYSVRFE